MISKPALSVIVCTHNPRAGYFNETMAALDVQPDLPDGGAWELLIVDNASDPPLAKRSDLRLPSRARVVVEPNLGLTHARRRSFAETSGDILIYVDDDNVLATGYLALAYTILGRDEHLGAIGGKVLPRFEVAPPPWFNATGISLACRDLGGSVLEASWNAASTMREYPECAPIGAGMALRRAAYRTYIDETAQDAVRLALGRRGHDLASGEDNDMIMTLLREGWAVAYRPELVLTHLIPAGRLEKAYLRRYAHASNRTWVQVLAAHGICPWGAIGPATAPLRKARAYLRMQPWRGPVQQISWASACGIIDGRASIWAARNAARP